MLPEEGDALPVTPTTHVYNMQSEPGSSICKGVFQFRPVSVEVSRDGSYFSEEDEV